MQKISHFLFCIALILQTTQQFATEIINQSLDQNIDSLRLEALQIDALYNIKSSLHNPEALVSNENLDLFPYFLRPISFTQQGIPYFFTNVYNHEKYSEFLPYNLSHMVQFLEFGQEQQQTEKYAQSIIKLFLQKIKGCDFMNSYSLLTIMPKLSDAFAPYIQKKEASFLQELQNSLKARFSHIFSSYYSYFQKSPDAFLDALSEQIAKKTNEVQTTQHIDVEHVKKDILRFLETCINKLIWSPQDGYDAWVAVNELANQAHQFLEKELITDVDALDDLYWSLIHRFCYFLDIAQHDISQETFIQIINDINTQELFLLQIEEQEDLITSKKDYLLKKIKLYCPYVYQIAPCDKIYELDELIPANENSSTTLP